MSVKWKSFCVETSHYMEGKYRLASITAVHGCSDGSLSDGENVEGVQRGSDDVSCEVLWCGGNSCSRSPEWGRPDEAVSCLLKAAVHGCCCQLVGHFTPVWASWSVLWKANWMKNSVWGEAAQRDVFSVSSNQTCGGSWQTEDPFFVTAKFLYFLVSRVHVVIKLQHYTLHVRLIHGAVLYFLLEKDVIQSSMMQCDRL